MSEETKRRPETKIHREKVSCPLLLNSRSASIPASASQWVPSGHGKKLLYGERVFGHTEASEVESQILKCLGFSKEKPLRIPGDLLALLPTLSLTLSKGFGGQSHTIRGAGHLSGH